MSSLGIFDKETKTYKKVADLSKPAVIDSSMSDTSTNAVQNKVVKSYVDTRTTLDTAMSDTSTKAVQNKVVKKYVDDRTNSVAWNSITGKPSTYTPSSHTHTKSQITDFPSSLPANGGNSATVNGHTVNSDVPSGAKFTDTTYNDATTSAHGLMTPAMVSKLNSIAEGANRTTVDSGMSDTSTNPVQNKAVKSYVDGRTTLDTSMSDTSTKAVQNKVVKSYVDTRTTFDASMSDTSTNAVQNKVVKSYVDTRTTLDTSMSDSSTKAVQNKVVKSYVDGKFKQKSIAYMGGDDKTQYCQLCTIKINDIYIDRPIEITVQERARSALNRLTVLFAGIDNSDPNLFSFKVFGEDGDWYISKRAASTWVIYWSKGGTWNDIRVVDYTGVGGVNVTWDVTGVTALPDSKTKAVWGGNVSHAVSADRANSVAWNSITGKPSTYTPSSHTHDDRYYTESEVDSKLNSKANSSHTHTKSQITDFPSSLPANGGNASTVNGHTVNSDVPSGAKFTDTNTWRPIGTTADTACAGNDSRLSNARPASDVYAWAKASSKPSYSWSEITSKPSTFSPHFDNNTWYAVGDDVYIGDRNHSGALGIRGANGNTSLDFCQYNNAGNFKSITFDGTTLYMNGSCDYASNAGSAVKLDTATAGSETQPVYFSGGKPVACSYTLGKSVPSNAVFTDAKVTNSLDTTKKAYVTATPYSYPNTGSQIFDTGVYLGTGTGQLTLEGSDSTNYTSDSSVLNVKMPAGNTSIYGVDIAPYDNNSSNYLTGLSITCGKSTSPGMRAIEVYCGANNYQPTVYINRSGTNSYALQVPKGKSYIATIYSNSSTITTSDREKKTDIQSISDKYEELFFKLQPRLFKFKDGTSGRIHIGAIAQEVEEALKEVGIPDTDFAGFVRQEKEYVVNEETGEITQEEGYDYYLRYEEFVMLLCHMLQKLYAEKEEQDNKISDLESRIVALESKLG